MGWVWGTLRGRGCFTTIEPIHEERTPAQRICATYRTYYAKKKNKQAGAARTESYRLHVVVTLTRRRVHIRGRGPTDRTPNLSLFQPAFHRVVALPSDFTTKAKPTDDDLMG